MKIASDNDYYEFMEIPARPKPRHVGLTSRGEVAVLMRNAGLSSDPKRFEETFQDQMHPKTRCTVAEITR
jgi:hypothetical protein